MQVCLCKKVLKRSICGFATLVAKFKKIRDFATELAKSLIIYK